MTIIVFVVLELAACLSFLALKLLPKWIVNNAAILKCFTDIFAVPTMNGFVSVCVHSQMRAYVQVWLKGVISKEW